jgi:hypothetical protein
MSLPAMNISQAAPSTASTIMASVHHFGLDAIASGSSIRAGATAAAAPPPVETTPNVWPQPRQKRESLGRSVPHCGQNISFSLVLSLGRPFYLLAKRNPIVAGLDRVRKLPGSQDSCRRSIPFSKATRVQIAFLISKSVSRKSYRKRMAQKSFTMWPSTNSSMASTVSFLTAVDKRFICLLVSVLGRQRIDRQAHFFHQRSVF